MIELQGVGFAWPDAPPLLSDIHLRVPAGDKVVLMGANGSGKSTLLKLLAGLVVAQRGEYRHAGVPVTARQLRDKGWLRSFRAQVGLVFQHPESMLFNPTVREEIGYGPRRLGWPDVEARVAHWAGLLGLTHRLDEAPFALSGGERQRVALAAVLALEPALLLLDEPAAHLDPRTTGWLSQHLRSMPGTVIVSTHSHGFAAGFGQRCIVLDQSGRIAFDGAATEALADEALLERTHLLWRAAPSAGPSGSA